MNIKQAEQQSGVARQNIRFYEKQGLLTPARNPDNDYREYRDTDIRTLKLIRALRMVDMPLEEIRAVLQGKTTLDTAAAAQQARLAAQAQQLQSAIKVCQDLCGTPSTQTLDVDALLTRMDAEPTPGGYFTGWVEDYRKLALSEHKKRFNFVPDDPVTNPKQFTEALLHYAAQNNLDIVITRESMYPQFTLDGVEYKAERLYRAVGRVPMAVVRCTVAHPEQYEPDIPLARRRLQKALHFGWPAAVLLGLILLSYAFAGTLDWLFTTPVGLLMLACFVVLCGVTVYQTYLLDYNLDGKKGEPKNNR